MSIRISNAVINQTAVTPNKRVVAFKSNSLPQDKVEISDKKKGLSTGAKVGIGLSVAAVLGLGIYKRKSLKNLWEKIFSGKSNKVVNSGVDKGVNNRVKDEAKDGVSNNAKTQIANTIHPVADFKNLDEAKAWFESIGVKTVFKEGSDRHLTDLNKIKNDLALLEKNGVSLPKPESIIVADWNNTEELKQILRQLNISEQQAAICKSGSWAWGTVAKGSDDKCHVLINSAFGGDYGRFIHEMGHIHQDYLHSSFWHTKLSSEKEFLDKQLEVFGLTEIGLHDGFLANMARNFRQENVKSIFRGYNLLEQASSETKEKIYRMFPDVGANDLEKIFSIVGKDGKTYYINAKKMVDKMASESGVYAPTKTWENVAEIFQGLNQGKEYSDLVMLMYDINGGGRVPTLIIKGKKYDDYIASLYNNPDLIRQLRECIEIKKLV